MQSIQSGTIAGQWSAKMICYSIIDAQTYSKQRKLVYKIWVAAQTKRLSQFVVTFGDRQTDF